jgi:hypothetical protein
MHIASFLDAHASFLDAHASFLDAITLFPLSKNDADPHYFHTIFFQRERGFKK